jgi:DNA modification methylase
MTQNTFTLKRNSTAQVECFGHTFESDVERREYFLRLLAQKLNDPQFRKIEGFPVGKDEDILALSDPPYYTACPNPWIGEFIEHYSTLYDPKKTYHREPFATDVSEGKNQPIYNAHSYHTKVPHRAIMRYLLHYTEPGEVVYDGFCGTGMTGVAAQLCGDRTEVQALGYRVQEDGTILNEEGKPFSKIGVRHAVLNDLSPAATLIAYNYNMPVDLEAFEGEANRILREAEAETKWMYETIHTDGKTRGNINFVVWSEQNSCPECGQTFVFYDEARGQEDDVLKEEFKCPHCSASLKKGRLDIVYENIFDPRLNATVKRPKRVPVLINYSVGKHKFQKKPNEADIKTVERIESTALPSAVPDTQLPDMQMMRVGRMKGSAVTHMHHFFLARPARILGLLWEKVRAVSDARTRALLEFWLDSHLVNLSIRNRYRPEVSFPYNPLTGVFYVPSMVSEPCVFTAYSNKLRRILLALTEFRITATNLIHTCSASAPLIPSQSVDYIFVDPPFGENIYYSDLNFFVEAWYGVFTNTKHEAIVDRVHEKELHDYSQLMLACFREFHRVLKPGRWMTIEFHNTQNSVWNAIQTTLQEAGFVVSNVSALDKQMHTFQAVNTTTATKQDLIITAYKPNGGLEDRFSKRGMTEEGVWDFIRTHLKNLPVVKAKGGHLVFINERDPRILYDRMVAFYVGHSTLVPLSSAEFQAGLAEKFPERDGMFFMPDQVNEYDKKRSQIESIGQISIFVEDERSATDWLRRYLKDRPSTYQDISPEFMQQLGASWKKWEARPELRLLLDQYFLCYDEQGDVPSQIHSYLSTQFKELRNLPKDHPQLKAKARNRWYVPDPRKNVDVESVRNKRLLQEFWSYLPDGYSPPSLSPNKGQTLPGLTLRPPKIPKGKKLKELRTEAIRVGFKHCYQQRDYQTILVVAEMIPDSVLNEDEQLQMIYDTAVTRTGGE